ncbi:hypothetical protein [Asticcacaulis endophyticus]|uniref:hypothetical protein n=1 Tax=Asticcacaulis endophyticus TaxID=1395890 RepID=UPI00167B5CD7|nr:hypothetical protein [Asticcacaulis endophyticus]
MFGHALDGLFWDRLRDRGALPKTTLTLEEPFWRGAYWAVFPKRTGTVGTNHLIEARATLVMTWSDAVTNRLNAYAQATETREMLKSYGHIGAGGLDQQSPLLAIRGKDDRLHIISDRIARSVVSAFIDSAQGRALLEAVPAKPGVYSGDIRLKSNTTVYIDGSAVIKSPLLIENVENVIVLSDGLFVDAGQTIIRNSKNVTIDGTIHINQKHGTMACFNSTNVREIGIRLIGGGQWSDGLGHFACQDVEIRNVFLRTSDDNITIYNHRWDTWGDSRNIRVSEATLWADVAHNVMMGIHGNTPSAHHPDAEVIENVTFRNVDVLDHDEDEPDYQGAIGLMVGDDNLVRNITFEDWRVERIEEGKLFSLQVLYNQKYNTSPGRGIDDIKFRNIHFTGSGAFAPSLIRGYSPDRKVRGISIENVTVGGKKLTGAQPDLLEIGDHVEGVSFK